MCVCERERERERERENERKRERMCVHTHTSNQSVCVHTHTCNQTTHMQPDNQASTYTHTKQPISKHQSSQTPSPHTPTHTLPSNLHQHPPTHTAGVANSRTQSVWFPPGQKRNVSPYSATRCRKEEHLRLTNKTRELTDNTSSVI